MEEKKPVAPSFNMWNEGWIGLERRDGVVERAGIGQALACANEYLSIYDPSPLVVAGIHRLLTAILQAALHPKSNRGLEKLWEQGRFPAGAIEEFRERYGERFDLFSTDLPFLQSADLGLKPARGEAIKTVAYLMPDLPAGTAVTHYRHGPEDGCCFCPSCAAAGLVMVPAFATSGGAGIKPSINGVPPIYILPGGENLFQSLAASLLLPEYLPATAPGTKDCPWWERPARVGKSSEVSEVGYLHSLTFPARRVRLHPEPGPAACTRCGAEAQWVVRTMVFEMGESRPDGAAFWQDPFAAYRLPEKDKEKPVPIRPVEGKAAWREFSGLFLRADSEPRDKKRGTIRPRVLDQMAALFADEPEKDGPQKYAWTFRCVGMRTDMKAKVFEWVDSGFDVPIRLLTEDAVAGNEVDKAMKIASDCANILNGIFREAFNANARKSDRFVHARTAMNQAYWSGLAGEFRAFIHYLDPHKPDPVRIAWAKAVITTARRIFHETLEQMPDDAATLRRRIQAEQKCSAYLYNRLKKEDPDD